MSLYCLYGLSIKLPWRVTGLQELNSGDAEIEFHESSTSLMVTEDGTARVNSAWFQFAALSDGSVYLRWTDLFEFTVSSDGRRITCFPLAKASPEVLRTYLLGQVLSFAMLKLRIEQLHCTAVLVDGEAVGLVGDCGYGKSSLAAAFLQAGHRLLTDDLLVVRRRHGIYSAFPGPPRIKLFPEVAREVLGSASDGVPMNNLTPKLIIPIEAKQSCRSSAVLRALYALNRPSKTGRERRISIRAASQRQAFVELTRNTFNCTVVEPARLKNQFAFASQLAARVLIRRLFYPRRFDLLPSVRQAILSDLVKL